MAERSSYHDQLAKDASLIFQARLTASDLDDNLSLVQARLRIGTHLIINLGLDVVKLNQDITDKEEQIDELEHENSELKDEIDDLRARLERKKDKLEGMRALAGRYVLGRKVSKQFGLSVKRVRDSFLVHSLLAKLKQETVSFL